MENSSADLKEREGIEEFSFVSVNPYARPSGLAGAYTALGEGLDAVSTNPAGLALQKKGKWASLGFKKNILDVNSGELTHFFKDSNQIYYAASLQLYKLRKY